MNDFDVVREALGLVPDPVMFLSTRDVMFLCMRNSSTYRRCSALDALDRIERRLRDAETTADFTLSEGRP